VALVALITAVLVAGWATSVPPPRAVVRVLLPPQPPVDLQLGPARPLDPVRLARDASLAAETIRTLRFRVNPLELNDRTDASFDAASRILSITVSRFRGWPEKAVANRLGLRVTEEWNASLGRAAYSAATLRRRRTVLARALAGTARELAAAGRRPSPALVTAFAQADAHLLRVDDRLTAIGLAGASQAFVYKQATSARAWSLGLLALAGGGGFVLGAALAIAALLRIDRRRSRVVGYDERTSS
jgi:hypothetical protein